ncbi:hypothetical protein H4R33_006064 [Dimargaris cristalligena]|nr:hypothetical protein H4R33_006064 [Dimargaris cristalligena]
MSPPSDSNGPVSTSTNTSTDLARPVPRPGDCFTCRLVGVTAFFGLGCFAVHEGTKLAPSLVYRRLGLFTMGLVHQSSMGHRSVRQRKLDD